jgi:ABC-type nitrate/sulfonate/bicarbonate transport system substrate-binding protein
MGGNHGLNSLFVQPEIKSYDDLRGKTMAVDSPSTAFALLLYKMLAVKGIKRGDYEVKAVGATHLRIQAMLKDKTFAAGILSPPGSIQAKRAGLKDFGSAVSVVGPYQSDAGWVLRSWGKANSDTLVRYIAANGEGIRWALDPANRAALTALVAARLKQPPDVVTEALKIADEQKGYAVDARFDMEGFRNVLRLRAELLGTWGGTPPAPEKYLDLSYYQRALAGL